ncbi:MAG: DUF885 domain-containing protein [Firmicutes bacterium]|nr:DUF885 domain-containing protein [Bacillota bacterium]
MNKQLLVLLCSATIGLSACASPKPTNTTNPTNTSPISDQAKVAENVDYATFLNNLFIEELENDYDTYHTYVQNVNDFNIDPSKIEVSLGDFYSEESDEKERLRDQANLEQLKTYDYNSMNEEEKDIYDQLVYTYERNERMGDSKYDYLGCIWSGTSSASKNLYNLFMEYSFYSERDIEDCITLINDVPRYIGQVMSFTKDQAQKGLLMINYDTVVSEVNDIIKSKEKKNVLNALVKAMDSLNLDEEKKKSYSSRLEEALNTKFYPAYQTIVDELAKIKGSNKEHVGLAKLENGKEYYLELLRYYTGTEDSPEDIRTKLKKIVNDAMSVIYTTYSDDTLSTGFKSTEDVMKFLEENYKQEFPEIKIPTYNVEALSAEQEQENVVAYYVIPAIDYTGSEKIRYNSHNTRANIDSLEFYQTLAHEGIPGHMYAHEYFREHFNYNIRYLLSNLGLSEGYATYVESRGLHFLNLDKDALKFENAYMALNNAYTCLMDISVNYDGMSYREFQKEYSDLFGNDLTDLYNTLCESPGIFMAYYYGYFSILELRQEAQKELGNKFDNVKFNAAILDAGEVNFDIVKRHVQQYIQTNK